MKEKCQCNLECYKPNTTCFCGSNCECIANKPFPDDHCISPFIEPTMLHHLDNIKSAFSEFKYIVIQRCDEPNIKFLTVIMILANEEKANALAKFLNEGKYFESEVTVEKADIGLANYEILNLLERTI